MDSRRPEPVDVLISVQGSEMAHTTRGTRHKNAALLFNPQHVRHLRGQSCLSTSRRGVAVGICGPASECPIHRSFRVNGSRTSGRHNHSRIDHVAVVCPGIRRHHDLSERQRRDIPVDQADHPLSVVVGSRGHRCDRSVVAPQPQEQQQDCQQDPAGIQGTVARLCRHSQNARQGTVVALDSLSLGLLLYPASDMLPRIPFKRRGAT